MDKERKKVFLGGLVFCLLLFLAGVLLGDIRTIPQGLYAIVTSQDVLITDYFEIAGPAAAFFNAGCVALLSLAILWVCKDPVNGYTFVVLGLMAGFSFFGKNLFNILPILLGTFLYSLRKKEPFGKYAPVGLLSTALAPAVSFFALSDGWGHMPLGIAVGLLIGFVIPPLSAYTYRIQGGMNLYNVGFACGLLALVIVPVAAAIGRTPSPALYWSTEYRAPLLIFLALLCAAALALGCAAGKKEGWKQYGRLLKTTGRAPADYYQWFGLSATLINMGVNGFLALGYLLVTKADVNGPMLGGFFAILGFAAFGKHARNIFPVMCGVALGGLVQQSLASPSIQLAALFGTTLAPLSGYFGWPVGVLAGFLHSCIVLRAGVAVEGVNLYNNGFSAGILAIVLYAILMPTLAHRRAKGREDEFFETVVEEHDPID